MGYTIEIVNNIDEKTDLALRHLIKKAFATTDVLPPNYLINNINSKASQPGFFVIAKEEGHYIGCNGFIANDFTVNDKPYIGYQSCWSAIDPDHWGKGIFTSLITEAINILKKNGAGFLYGIPSENSLPGLIKLGFTEMPSLVLRLFNTPFFRSLYLRKGKISKKNACYINEHQVLNHKAMQFPLEVSSFEHNNSLAWGKKIKKTRYGIQIPVFYIGGIQLDQEADLGFLFSKILKAHKVVFIQVLSCGTNSINSLMKGWKRSKHMKGFVFYNLNMPVIDHFNLMIGAIDVF